jgi:hypothetical protein
MKLKDCVRDCKLMNCVSISHTKSHNKCGDLGVELERQAFLEKSLSISTEQLAPKALSIVPMPDYSEKTQISGGITAKNNTITCVSQ